MKNKSYSLIDIKWGFFAAVVNNVRANLVAFIKLKI